MTDIPPSLPHCRPKGDTLKVISVNVNGLSGKIDQVRALVSAYTPDVVLVQESKLANTHLPSTLTIAGYELFRKDRNANGGGVCIYANSALQPTLARCRAQHEIIGINIRYAANCAVQLYSVYKPPTTPADPFYADLADVATIDAGTTLVIAGDTNVNVLEAKKAQFVNDRCREMGVTQWVHEGTHLEACIDHAMVTTGRQVSNVRLLHPIEKHHSPVHFDVHVPRSRPSPPDVGVTRQWRKANWCDMELWLNAQQVEATMAKAATVDDCCDLLTRYCNEAQRLFVPQRPARRPKQQWVQRETVKQLRRRDRLYNKCKRASASADDKQQLKKVQKLCRKMLASDKHTWLAETFGSPTTFWPAVRKLLRPSTSTVPPLRDGVKTAHTDGEKADVLRRQYETVWTADTCEPDIEHGPLERIECTAHWARLALRRLGANKAGGPDGVSPRLIRKMADALAPGVALIITRSAQTGTVPAAWKSATVVPVPKVKGSTNAADYRPISLTSAVGKIAERFMLENIIDAIDVALPSTQYGFRRGMSTTDALVDAEHTIMLAMDECDGASRVAVVSFDVSRAFDSISHSRLLEHLQKRFHVPLYARRWLHSFLNGRSQRVRVGSTYSAYSTVTSGTVQGSVVGPVLYTAATAGIKDVKLSKGARIIVYADDLLLVKRVTSTAEEHDLQADCDTIVHYLAGEQLHVNAKKTQHMIASVAPAGAQPLAHELLVSGTVVEQSRTIKYLGILLDERMTFARHAHTVAAKARRMINAVTGTLRRWHMRAEMARIYTACIRPTITYGLAVVHARTDDGRRAVEQVNRAAARAVLNTYTADYASMMARLRWPTIAALAALDRLRLLHTYERKNAATTITTTTTTTTTTANATPAPIWRRVVPEDARRSARRTNGRTMKIADKAARLSRSHDTALRTMVREWNSLPHDVVAQPTLTAFMNALKKNNNEILNKVSISISPHLP